MPIKGIVFYFFFIVLFFLQGAQESNAINLLLILAFVVFPFLSENKKSIILPNYYILAWLVYLFYLGIGVMYYKHTNPTIDIKFQVFSFIFFLSLLNWKKIDLLNALFLLNYISFAIYILIVLGLIPNIWHDTQEFNLGRRVYGPSIISFILIGFIYLYNNKSFDKKLGVAFLLAVIYILMTANFMNLLIVLILFTLIIADLKKLFNPKFIIAFSVVVFSVVYFLQNSSYVPIIISKKAEYITKPWEYPSFKIRIEDLQKATHNENFGLSQKLIGKGYGASTSIYRENKIATSWSRVFTFQEIDNGFYYIYHRGGYSLLFIFLISHAFLYYKIPNKKAKLAFISVFFITNLLSIHYYNYMFYLIIPYYILTSPLSIKYVTSYNSVKPINP